MMSDTAIGRSLPKIILGGFGAAPEASALAAAGGEERTVRSADATDIATLLAYSRKVMIVPGYGSAVAQAQHVAVRVGPALEAGASRWPTPYTRWPGDARAHERVAR